MANPTNVKELFSSLEERLLYFETNRFNTYFFNENESWEEFDIYTPNIFNIAKNASLFDPEEVLEEAKFLEGRVLDILNDLKPLEKINVTDNNGQRDVIKVPEGFKKALLQRWKEEFINYQTHLQSIQKLALKRIEAKPTANVRKVPIQVNQINLPENFTVKQLQSTKNAKLTLDRSALFLYYLRQTEILPPYSDSGLGKLAEAFLVRNEKTIRDRLSNIHDLKRSKEDLEALKQELQAVFDAIDEDLEKAR